MNSMKPAANSSLRKHRLVVEAAEDAGVSNVLCGRIVETLLAGIVREVADGGEVRLGRFGSFVCVPSASGVEEGGAKGKRAVRFRPGKTFRDALHL